MPPPSKKGSVPPKNMYQGVPPPPYEDPQNPKNNSAAAHGPHHHNHNNNGSSSSNNNNSHHHSPGGHPPAAHQGANPSQPQPPPQQQPQQPAVGLPPSESGGAPRPAGSQYLPLYHPPAPAPGVQIDEDMLEDHISFLRTVAAFHHYRSQSVAACEMRKANFLKLQSQHKNVLCIDLDEMFKLYDECISRNSAFFENVCEASLELFMSYWPDGTTVARADIPPPTALDMDKVFSTLRQFVRDWSVEGQPERECVYKPVLDFFEKMYPSRDTRSEVKILIPGAGLCRLSVELAYRGFFAQANEFSYHMLIAGHYIQNHCYESKQHVIYPYCDNTCNLVNRLDQFAEIAIPDLCAAEALDELRERQLPFGELSMVAGDFTEVYAKEHQQRSWNAVATVFFIDTAHNIIEYLQIIFDLLLPGGYWVNCGPLLYHFADSAEDMSIELSLGELISVAQKIGFEVCCPPSFIDTTYTNNQRSMKQLVYRCAFFVLQRPLEGAGAAAAAAAA